MRSRKLLARSSNVAIRERVYRVPEGLEVDEIDHFEVRRSRVLFDDVVLMTLRRYRGTALLSVLGTLLIGVLVLCYFLWTQEPIAAWIVLGTAGVPLLLAFVVRAAFGVSEINVYSRRTQATLRFISQSKARAVAGELAAEIRERQMSDLPETGYSAEPPPLP